MDAISAKYFSNDVDALISDNLNHLYTYLHTIENLLSIKKKFNAVDPLFMEYISKITELHYMLKTGKLKPQVFQSQVSQSQVSQSQVLTEEKLTCLSDVQQHDVQNDDQQYDTNPSTATIVNAMDEADLQLDTHINNRREAYKNSIINVPVPKTPIKWLTDSEPDITARTVESIEYPLTDSCNKSTINDDFEVVEETTATTTDIIASLEARRQSDKGGPQALPVVPAGEVTEPAAKPKSLSAITAERLGVHFCTPDDEPATVNALFKIGPKHRDMLYTKLYTKAKANITLLNPESSKFDELVRLETDRLLSEWIAAH